MFNDHHRSGHTGGGTGVLCRSSLGLQKISGGQKRSFEYSEYSVTLDNRKCHLYAIYRPPYSERHPVNISVFFEEFADYLESVVVSVDPIIISGDFNIHIDVPDDPCTVKFLSILECLGLKNHVFNPTYESGHALDLFITRKDCDFQSWTASCRLLYIRPPVGALLYKR